MIDGVADRKGGKETFVTLSHGNARTFTRNPDRTKIVRPLVRVGSNILCFVTIPSWVSFRIQSLQWRSKSEKGKNPSYRCGNKPPKKLIDILQDRVIVISLFGLHVCVSLDWMVTWCVPQGLLNDVIKTCLYYFSGRTRGPRLPWGSQHQSSGLWSVRQQQPEPVHWSSALRCCCTHQPYFWQCADQEFPLLLHGLYPHHGRAAWVPFRDPTKGYGSSLQELGLESRQEQQTGNKFDRQGCVWKCFISR